MSYDRYDTSVTEMVKNNPLAFVDKLNEAASIYPEAGAFLHEAAHVIANLLLTDEDWHNPAFSRFSIAIARQSRAIAWTMFSTSFPPYVSSKVHCFVLWLRP